MEPRFTKRQLAAIRAYKKAHDRFEELGLLAWAQNDSLHVIRETDFLKYEGSVAFASASECINYLGDNDLPEVRIGTVYGVGD